MVGQAFEEALTFSDSNGRYVLPLDDRWEAQPGNVFGGFVLAAVVRVAGLASTAARPVSLACQFLRPVVVGVPLEATVVSMRRGRTNELLEVTLTQAEKTAAMAQLRAVDDTAGPEFHPLQRPVVGDPSSYVETKHADRVEGLEPARFLDEVEWRDPRGPVDGYDISVWWRLGPSVTFEDPWLDAARIAIGMDASGGAVVSRFEASGHLRKALPWGFSNLDALIHFHGSKGTDWLHVQTEVLTAFNGYASTRTQAWSEDAALMATAISQLAFFDTSGR